jgi:hypothetical protein
MTDRTTDDLRDAYGRRYMIHVCKDGTVTYRDTVAKEKVFNGRALPVFSVDTIEDAKSIQVRFCRLQYVNHPLMPGKPWYKLNEFSGKLEDLDRVRNMFAEFYKAMKERDAQRQRDDTAALVSRAARTRRTRKSSKAKNKCA